jgi:hypothetical protein
MNIAGEYRVVMPVLHLSLRYNMYLARVISPFQRNFIKPLHSYLWTYWGCAFDFLEAIGQYLKKKITC